MMNVVVVVVVVVASSHFGNAPLHSLVAGMMNDE